MAAMKKKMLSGPISKKALGLTVAKKSQSPKVIKATTKPKPRAAYVRQAAKMTSEKFKSLQVGMDEKWPAPEYMQKVEKGRSHTCYRDETYMTITRWTADTKIQYRPHAKAPGSKSHIRYEKYSKARTVKEALKLGSWPADWCWDYERGFIRVVGGRIRDEPIDSSEADTKGLDEVDSVLARWFIREAARMLGISLKELRDDQDAKDELLLRMKRKQAESKAIDILKERSETGRKLTENEVFTVLSKWGYRKNITRPNVTPEGSKFVFSDTLGLVSDRKGNIQPTKYTLAYPNVTKLVCDFMTENLPKDIPEFSFTGINVNKNYAGKRHRDGNNLGPSIIKAIGEFKGGNLNYYPNDDRTLELEDLPKSDKVSFDLKNNWALFDGRRAHEVDKFTGDRISLVYFTCPRNDRIDAKTRAAMLKCGFPLPTKKSTERNMTLMSAPSGYGNKDGKKAKESKYKTGGPKYKMWQPQKTIRK